MISSGILAANCWRSLAGIFQAEAVSDQTIFTAKLYVQILSNLSGLICLCAAHPCW